jgi:hypothetical protein
MSKRASLSIQEIKTLNGLLRQVFGYITDLKTKEPLASKIKYPQLPSVLTESFAIHLLKRKFILSELDGFHFDFGGRTADVLAIKDLRTIKIEVKATAKSAFEYFGEKDLSADYLLWFHFDEFYLNSNKTVIEVFVIKQPANYFSKPRKITLSQLKQILGKNLTNVDVDVNSL